MVRVMERVLVASPVRGGVSPAYVRALMGLLFSKANKPFGGPNAPFDFQWAATSGTSVAMARDELAHLAIRDKYDRLVFWDIDLGSANPDVTLAMFARLLSHKEDVVAGQYVGHNFISSFHGARVENAEPRPDGLMEMAQIPLGFSYIKTSALKKIMEAKPERRYMQKETGREGKPDMFEFFPNGVRGPNTAEGKIEKLKEIIPPGSAIPVGHMGEKLSEIASVLGASDYSANIMLGEDYYFCALARESGVKLFIDNNLIVPHDTGVRLPVRNQDILTELTQPWRLSNDGDLDKVGPILEQLRPLLSNDLP